MKTTTVKSGFCVAITFASTQIFASGFALNEQSVSGMGTGFAGRTSSVDDASIVYGNPAGMSRLKRAQATVGVAAIDASTDINDTRGRSTGTNKGDMVPFTAVPMGFYVNPFDENWTFGLGVYAPFGLVTDYESNFQGRNFGSKSVVKVVTFQPTFSYAFNEKVSIGFGPTINRLSGTLESALNVSGLLGASTGDGRVQLKGDDVGYGFNAGILVQATDTTSVGLTYHSKVTYKVEGHTDVTPGVGVPSAILPGGRYDAKLNIDTPESVDFSVTQKMNDAWKLYAGATWTRWSRLEDLTVRNSGITPVSRRDATQALVGTIAEEQNWHDTWAYAVGTSYQLNKQWVMRTGLSFDQSPTNNENRSPRISTGDRTIFSLGAGYSPTEDITIDVAYSYLQEEKVKVAGANALGQSYNAKYDNRANGFGLGMTYRF